MKKIEDLNEMKEKGGAILKLISKGLGAKHIAVSLSIMRPGERVSHHRHEKAEEIYLLVQGSSQVIVNNERFEVEAFTAVRFPPETMRSVVNNSNDDAVWVFIGAPAAEFTYEN